MLFQPDEQSTYYLSHGTSFNASGDLINLTPAPSTPHPSKAATMSWVPNGELLNGDLSMRTALFRTIKYNRAQHRRGQRQPQTTCSTASATPTALSSEAAGRITNQLEVFTSLALQRGIIDKAGDPAINGSQNNEGKTSGLTPA